MKKTIIVPTCAERLDLFCGLVHSIIEQPQLDCWHLDVVIQGHFDPWLKRVKSEGVYDRISSATALPHHVGPHIAKLKMLETTDADVVASCDDDMLMMSFTDYDKMAIFASAPNVGFVSGNFMPHAGWAHKKRLEDRFIKQPIVYTAGGLVFTRKMIPAIAAIGYRNLWCDNTEWSLAAYIRGYENYRFLGSLAIHHVCRGGGRRKWIDVDKPDLQMPPRRLIDYESGKIPNSGHLTAYAKRLHRFKQI